jgi:hypothetical protein
MPHYRLYCIDAAGRFFRCEEIEAPDDAEAARLSIALRGSHAAELWSGARLVTSFEAAAGTQPPPPPPRKGRSPRQAVA